MRASRSLPPVALDSVTSRPSVAVIVPCYRYAHLLEGCVHSVLSQEGVDVRVLIVDDLSPDDTPAVGKRLAESDERVEYRRHAQNMGLIASANEGLEWACELGEYVVLLSADDLLVPRCLLRATAVMGEHAQVGMVYGRPLVAYEGRPLPQADGRWRATDMWSGRDWIATRCRSGHNCMSSPEVVVRSSVQSSVGGYDARCHHTSDLNMWLRIASVSDIAYIRGVGQAVYRVHSASMQRTQEGGTAELRGRQLAFETFFSACAQRLEDAERLRARVMRELARQSLWRASRAVDRGAPAEQVEDYVSFALEICPGAPRLREWLGLSLRRRLGAGGSRAFLPFLATGAAHRVRLRASQMRLKLRGV
jgi:hypothetical protein